MEEFEEDDVEMDENIRNIEVIRENLAYMIENHGEIYEAYRQYGNLVHEKGGPLEEKTRWLIKVALSTEAQYPYALKTHIQKAMKCGCTKEEIEHAILLVAPTSGFPKTMEGLLVLRDLLMEKENPAE